MPRCHARFRFGAAHASSDSLSDVVEECRRCVS
jgi:hypothetical protein